MYLVSTQELLSAGRALTYEDLNAMLGNQILFPWFTPQGAIAGGHGLAVSAWKHLYNDFCYFFFSADGKGIYAFAHSPEH
jgi:hypothetical protein